MTSSGKTVKDEAPFSTDDHISLLGGTAVDRIRQVVERAIRIVDRHDACSLEGLARSQIGEFQIWAAPIDVDSLGKRLEKRGFPGTTVEDAHFDCVQTLRHIGHVGHQLVVPVGDFRRLLKSSGDRIFSGVVLRGRIEVSSRAPFDEHIVHGFPIQCGLRAGVVDIDGSLIAGDADNVARLGRCIASTGHHPRHGGHARAAELERIDAGRCLGIVGSVAHPALSAAAGHPDINLAVRCNGDDVGIFPGVILELCSGRERSLDAAAGLVAARVVEGHKDQALARIRRAVAIEVVIALVSEIIVLAPAGVFLAAAELVMDVDEVGN